MTGNNFYQEPRLAQEQELHLAHELHLELDLPALVVHFEIAISKLKRTS